MPRKKQYTEKQTPGTGSAEARPQLIQLVDLIPRKDVAGGKRLLFGAVNHQPKTRKDG
jgi:hypothetical protein